MKIKEIIECLEIEANPYLKEEYDNIGLLVGNINEVCTGVLITLDVTEKIIEEALQKGCNLIVAHHPVIFKPLQKITGKNYIEKIVISAIKNNISIYAIHTNIDNVNSGVNGHIAQILELTHVKSILPKENIFCKLFTFVPESHAKEIRKVLFKAGAGSFSNYNECSFNTFGNATFKAVKNANPFVGELEKQHTEKEVKIETIFPIFLKEKIVSDLIQNHPYEEVAYDIINLENNINQFGSGIIGYLPQAIPASEFLSKIKRIFKIQIIKHTTLPTKSILKVAICGGAGSFLTSQAIKLEADVFITSDIKYHEYFDAENRLMLCDIGHYESEQFTIDLIAGILAQKFPTFAILKTEINTNPIQYYI